MATSGDHPSEDSQLKELSDGMKEINLVSESEKDSDKKDIATCSPINTLTVQEATTQNGGMCQNCSKSDGICYCKVCFLILCESCATQHKELKPFDAHLLLSMKAHFDIISSTKNEYCPSHGKPLFLYCLTCKCCVCQECRVDPDHINHSIKLVSDYIREDVIAEYDAQKKELEERMESLKREQEEIVLEGERAMRDIDLKTQALKDQLTEYGRQIHEQVDKNTKQKISTLRGQEKDADEMIQELQDCQRYVEFFLQYARPEQVLMYKQDLMKYVNSVVEKAQKKNYDPLVEADISITKN